VLYLCKGRFYIKKFFSSSDNIIEDLSLVFKAAKKPSFSTSAKYSLSTPNIYVTV
jgi:hypothetical protein